MFDIVHPRTISNSVYQELQTHNIEHSNQDFLFKSSPTHHTSYHINAKPTNRSRLMGHNSNLTQKIFFFSFSKFIIKYVLKVYYVPQLNLTYKNIDTLFPKNVDTLLPKNVDKI